MNIDAEMNTAKRSGVSVKESKEIDKRIRKIRKHKKDYNERVIRESIDERANKFRLEAKQLEKGKEAARDTLHQQTSMTDMKEYNLILEGL